MTRPAPTETDVVELLIEQHEQIRNLFTEILAAHGHDRFVKFHQLRRLLAVHEAAEEVIVHPRAKFEIPYGYHVIEQRLIEERESKRLLTRLETLDVDSAQFEAKLTLLRNALMKHAAAEERMEFTYLNAPLDPDQCERLSRLSVLADSVAPSHAGSDYPSVAEAALSGPFNVVVERIREFLDDTSLAH